MATSNRHGGRANETGSTYRAAIAAYLAAHGLADAALRIDDAIDVGAPESLWLETTSAVDDVRCRFTTGQRWDIQAKRSCTWGPTFTKVVGQWVEAARTGDLEEGDRVVLVSGRLSGPLKLLGSAFRRLREDVTSELLPKEAKEYARFRQKASDEGWADVLDKIAAKALIIELAAGTEQNAGTQEVAFLLDSTVVSRGAGHAAINALEHFFQNEATRSGASNTEEWLRVLDRAGIESGPISVEVLAGRARTLSAYRDVLARRLDRLEVDHLASGVPPMEVSGLLGMYRVDLPGPSDSHDLGAAAFVHVARRWPHFALVGLAGSGKSTALEQLAAAWALDLEAPLPVLVRLHRIVPLLRDRQHIGIADITRLGDNMPSELVSVVEERLRAGTAALLLDGLDECRNQQNRGASLVRRLATELHPESGLIVSARDAASNVVGVTGLPIVALREPDLLSVCVSRLVDHVFDNASGKISHDDVTIAKNWIRASQDAHRDIWRVPLFAVLLAVHATRMSAKGLPTTRASALVAAIQDSVARWEREKRYEIGAWHEDLHPNLLIDGFADIGHAVVTSEASVGTATEAVAQAVMFGWGYSRRRADAMASDIVRWWVDRVGAFVVETDLLQARVRLMGEIGDAMWAARQTRERRAQWLERVITHDERYREPALLAAALQPAIVEELIETVKEPIAALLAADAILEGAAPKESALAHLVDQLAHFAEDHPARTHSQISGYLKHGLFRELAKRQLEYDGPAWPYILALARLSLPPALRRIRNQAIHAVENHERRVVAKSVATATDCTMDDRRPLADEQRALEAVLALPPPTSEAATERRSRRHVIAVTTMPVLSGRTEAAVNAIELVALNEETAANTAQLAKYVGVGSTLRLVDAIEKAGFSAAVEKTSLLSDLVLPFDQIRKTYDSRDDRFVLQEAAGTQSEAMLRQEPTRPWRLAGAAALFEILELRKHGVDSTMQAVDRFPHVVRDLVLLAIPTTGLSPVVIAEDARRALELLNDDPLEIGTMLRLPQRRDRAPSSPAPPITSDDFATLRTCVVSGNSWLFWTSAQWLANSGKDEAHELLWRTLPEMPARHRRALAGWLAEAMGRTEAYPTWLEGGDTILRLVAARAIGKAAQDSTVILALAGDSDLMVRLETVRGLSEALDELLLDRALTIASEAPLKVWTCSWCGSVESINMWDCVSCSRGDRPDLQEEVRRLKNR